MSHSTKVLHEVSRIQASHKVSPASADVLVRACMLRFLSVSS